MGSQADIAEIDAGFPRKRCSAGAIIRDSERRLLVLNPTYRDGWLLPGGIVEAGESPLEALHREVKEETGFIPKPISLVCIDHLEPAHGFSEAVHFLFECQDIEPDAVLSLCIDTKEVAEFKFVFMEEARKLLLPAISRRLQEVQAGRFGYFHNGVQLIPFTAGGR